jgi:hypothetical protein
MSLDHLARLIFWPRQGQFNVDPVLRRALSLQEALPEPVRAR